LLEALYCCWPIKAKPMTRIAEILEIGRATVQRVRKRSCQKGLDHALTELPRPGATPRLDGRQEAYLVALACSDAPQGRPCWTLHLLANTLVQLHVVEGVSDETVRRVVKTTRLLPWLRTRVVHSQGWSRMCLAHGRAAGSVHAPLRRSVARCLQC
jgi:transposase